MDHKLDVLAIGAHPDDIEIFCGGTVCLLVSQGYRVGIVDLTRGELGTRGSAELRATEAERAAELLGVVSRENLEIPDGNIENSQENQRRLVTAIRTHRPDILLVSAVEDRHPDHGDASELCISSAFYAGLGKIVTEVAGVEQAPWRPEHVLHYMQGVPFVPDLVIDVGSVWAQRTEAVRSYSSQIHDIDYKEGSDEPETFISDPGFLKSIDARARSLGYRIGAERGEGFLYHQGPIGVKDLPSFLSGGGPV